MNPQKNFGLPKIISARFSLILFILLSHFIIFGYGLMAEKYKLFPSQIISKLIDNSRSILSGKKKNKDWWIYLTYLKKPFPNILGDTTQANKGLTLVTKLTTDMIQDGPKKDYRFTKEKNRKVVAEIIDLNGKVVQQWNVDWFEMWPNPEHIPESGIPKKKPGTNIYGAVVMENGDLIFNFDQMGTMRINPNGEIIWRLAYQTNHSLHKHDDGTLWASGGKNHQKRTYYTPHRLPPVYDSTIVKFSPEGKILKEWSIAEILYNNGYAGLLYQGIFEDEWIMKKEGYSDILHLNDVEPFPSTLEEGFFKKGDVMVSLRNINTIFVFNSETEKIKFITTGKTVRQRDPDFIDGNTFSVFDTNSTGAKKPPQQSRIVIFSAPENTSKVFFEGSPENPFFTIMYGKHQWQPNGNLLITESVNGRGFEVNPQGEIVWQYVNYVDEEEGVAGIVTEVQRLPVEYNDLFPVKKSDG